MEQVINELDELANAIEKGSTYHAPTTGRYIKFSKGADPIPVGTCAIGAAFEGVNGRYEDNISEASSAGIDSRVIMRVLNERFPALRNHLIQGWGVWQIIQRLNDYEGFDRTTIARALRIEADGLRKEQSGEAINDAE